MHSTTVLATLIATGSFDMTIDTLKNHRISYVNIRQLKHPRGVTVCRENFVFEKSVTKASHFFVVSGWDLEAHHDY